MTQQLKWWQSPEWWKNNWRKMLALFISLIAIVISIVVMKSDVESAKAGIANHDIAIDTLNKKTVVLNNSVNAIVQHEEQMEDAMDDQTDKLDAIEESVYRIEGALGIDSE